MASKVLSRKVTIYVNGKEVESNLKFLRVETRKLVNEQAQLGLVVPFHRVIKM